MQKGETRWLTDLEAAAWIPLLSTAMRLPAALDQQLQADAGLSNFEYGVMAALSMRAEKTMRMSELARVANSTLPRLSKVIDRLDRNGWVVRRPDPTDGRSTLATLTRLGVEKVSATAPGHVARVRHLVFDQITPAQVRQLGAIMTKLSAALGHEA
ncbi:MULTISPECIES: MarR family winged helix-turn-helix transcriptional regulator [Subtercola]|uniref:MarR family transcriptional regulator n=1 Tax=Subtercola vilae TaxID=2056433 RepID=A0A4T2BKA2_9MICO|nr:MULTISPECIES: MarR family transcriptional regulator [Subtercola]MEA9986565.1 MarR family transcriptional regulator [Subtercola sp. RTI3]TIH32063.1 MarR family transcriptional regulator [Subtercola vilae]